MSKRQGKVSGEEGCILLTTWPNHAVLELLLDSSPWGDGSAKLWQRLGAELHLEKWTKRLGQNIDQHRPGSHRGMPGFDMHVAHMVRQGCDPRDRDLCAYVLQAVSLANTSSL